MTNLDELLAIEPLPPAVLAARLAGSDSDASVEAHAALAAAAAERLGEACARPGRVRETAFTLLEADALLTYACEAAVDAADPEAALLDVLATVSG